MILSDTLILPVSQIRDPQSGHLSTTDRAKIRKVCQTKTDVLTTEPGRQRRDIIAVWIVG